MEKKGIQSGVVVKSTGSWYAVRTPENSVVQCRIIGKFRLNNLNLTNPVAVGDAVEFVFEQDDKGLIKKILPRRNYVARQSPRRRHDIHLLASNIDQVLLFVTIVEPDLKQGFIDRFLLTTEPQDIPTLIVFNKADLYDEQALAFFTDLEAIYSQIGYKVLKVSAVSKEGLEELKELLKDKTTLIAGQSGVGKSTVVNALEPRLDLRTGDISDYSGKGQHTTTFAEIHTLSFGGYLIDSPGIKSLSFNNLEPSDVTHNFREFFRYSENCRFGGNCTHREEPHCAVKKALEAGEISAVRYGNYLQILEEISDLNYWERHKGV
jgi:ribosome biogenesis GTPase / thiamine phosphate phosphatase